MAEYSQTLSPKATRAWFLELAIRAADATRSGAITPRELCIAAEIFQRFVETGDDD